MYAHTYLYFLEMKPYLSMDPIYPGSRRLAQPKQALLSLRLTGNYVPSLLYLSITPFRFIIIAAPSSRRNRRNRRGYMHFLLLWRPYRVRQVQSSSAIVVDYLGRDSDITYQGSLQWAIRSWFQLNCALAWKPMWTPRRLIICCTTWVIRINHNGEYYSWHRYLA